MATPTHIDFDGRDYLLNGKPLLAHLSKHESVQPTDYVPAFLGAGSLKHYILEREPDLIEGATALYLCGFCGGYDGLPIGAKIEIQESHVLWKNLGFYMDFEDETCPTIFFSKVRSYIFERSNYMNFIADAKIHETPYYG